MVSVASFFSSAWSVVLVEPLSSRVATDQWGFDLCVHGGTGDSAIVSLSNEDRPVSMQSAVAICEKLSLFFHLWYTVLRVSWALGLLAGSRADFSHAIRQLRLLVVSIDGISASQRRHSIGVSASCPVITRSALFWALSRINRFDFANQGCQPAAQ